MAKTDLEHMPIMTRSTLGKLALSMAAVIMAGTLALVLVAQFQTRPSSYGVDFKDYLNAASQMAHGHSPYAPEMLSGPVPAKGLLLYRYPPPLAQALIPVAGWSDRLAATAWLVLQSICLALALALPLRRRMRVGLSEVMIAVLATFGSLTVFSDLLQGNVAGPMALLVAVVLVSGPALAGAAVMGLVLLKVSPILLLPALLLRGRRAWAGAALTAILVGGASLLLAPAAWREYAVVLPNMLAGAVDYSANMAPAGYLSSMGVTDPWIGLARGSTLLVAAGMLLASLLLARRPGGWPAAVGCGLAAAILTPGVIWQHYFVILLPLMAWAWPVAGRMERLAMSAGWLLLGVGFFPVGIPVAWMGVLLVAGSLAGVLWRPAEGLRRDLRDQGSERLPQA